MSVQRCFITKYLMAVIVDLVLCLFNSYLTVFAYESYVTSNTTCLQYVFVLLLLRCTAQSLAVKALCLTVKTFVIITTLLRLSRAAEENRIFNLLKKNFYQCHLLMHTAIYIFLFNI